VKADAAIELLRRFPERINWLRVLGAAEMPDIDQGVRHQLHAVVPTLEMLKPHQ
jgi:hypothetical protein